MRVLKFILFASVLMSFETQACAQISVLDKPISITSSLEILPTHIKQTSWFPKLDENDAEPLMEALSILGSDVFSGELGVTDAKQKEAVFVALVSGLTPRKIILWGHTVRLMRAQAAIYQAAASMKSATNADEVANLRLTRAIAGGRYEAALRCVQKYSRDSAGSPALGKP